MPMSKGCPLIKRVVLINKLVINPIDTVVTKLKGNNFRLCSFFENKNAAMKKATIIPLYIGYHRIK